MEKRYADIFSSPEPDIIFVFNKRSTLCCIFPINIVLETMVNYIWMLMDNGDECRHLRYLYIDNFKLKEYTIPCEINYTTGLSFATRAT